MSEKKKKPVKKHLKLDIRPLLEQRGLSIAAFARLAGMDYRTAYDIVKGKYKRIGLDTLGKIVIALDCRIEELFVWE